MSELRAEVDYLLSPLAIRERCERLFALGEAGELPHFSLDLSRLDTAAERVEAVVRADYPDLQIPYHSRWRHFDVGPEGSTVPRLAAFDARIADLEPRAQGRARFDLVVTSVLLDAGAGPDWRFREDGVDYGRSEGLAVASLRMFEAGHFSSDPSQPLQADAAGLQALTAARLGEAFQVGPDNPLVGLEGRTSLLNALGAALAADPERFGGRVGGLFDRLADAASEGALPAPRVLAEVLGGLGSIWPGRVELAGVNLGDVWPHPSLPEASSEAPGADLVPFHKLSQWLSYSLLEPLEQCGLEVTDLDSLTGLPEYRNGGLFLDTGVLSLKDASARERGHLPGSPLIVEWRALTVCLLDRVAVKVRERLGLSAAEFPLAKVLQGGTWTAGRRIAAELRPGGGPPLRLESDGTVF
jgi:uncharacterized protein DUF1688